jgi:hypothetical protein
MSFARRLRLDFSPAFLAMLALSGMSEFCFEYSKGPYPWSVDAANSVGIRFCVLWWVWSDSVRRCYALMPVWGSWMVLDAGSTAIAYLLASRGWWGFLTLFFYGFAFALMGWLVRFFV